MQTQEQADSTQKASFNENWSSVQIIQKKISRQKKGNRNLQRNEDNSETKTENIHPRLTQGAHEDQRADTGRQDNRS